MNTFADSLLSLLLSWMRSIISTVWLLINGDTTGFLNWLGRFWGVLLVILLGLGLALDALVYLLRWRPHYVWRTQLYRLLHPRREHDEEARFSEGYEQGIEDFQFQDSVEAFLQQPREEALNPEIMPYYSASPVSDAQPIDMRSLPGGDQLPVERRRRSTRHVRRVYLTEKLRIRLPALGEEASSSAYPAPPVRAREAFHEPVYPASVYPGYADSQQQTNQDDGINDV